MHVASITNNPGSGNDCCVRTSSYGGFYQSSASHSGACFDDAALADNIGFLKANKPFPGNLQEGASGLKETLNAECNWCCSKYVELKETVFNVQTASAGVIRALASPPEGADETMNVYYSLPCTDFDADNDACKYNVKLSELVEITPDWNAEFPSDSENVDDFVFWRYNRDGGEWVEWDRTSDEELSFAQPGTTINIEGWTACGQIGTSYSFSVNLDFTLLHFAYDATKVVPHGAGTVTGDYAGAKCEIMLKDEDSTVAATATATLVESTATTLSKDFAVELVHDPNTAQKTAGQIVQPVTREPVWCAAGPIGCGGAEGVASETTTALLDASAMVAIVALVVAKRRADVAAGREESEDGYYQLLE
ncbi:unnamed protein product [Phytophthora lilii]|uniref:Unnamed protein product n=1 Tax=Phytophthora lilii TaxID=2077276 RepID=A0A9W6TY11_9STRA|nr:unnamed protein product [Phytophthora lilii]